MTSEQIVAKANRIQRKYETRNPFTIARQRGIIVAYEPLGTIHGYYNTLYRQRFIHINRDLRSYQQKYVCAHELGHAILHPNMNTHYLRERTLYSVGKYEREAKLFAAHLLISDDELKEHRDFTYEQLSTLFGVDEDIIRLRCEA